MSDFQQAKETFLQQLNSNEHVFATTLEFIETWFDFTPSAFQNGSVANAVDQNQGSCKVFALAELLELTQEQALRCFGEHYRDVVATPDADNHHNLRRLLKEGLADISFDSFPLTQKA
ncbi:HopJ type III effector protein [Bacterioplanoides sp.]|uniref:HopJ type III effector protein n=1 Tax=Bacterioplanoides sp. TaxID=2066072 RepID=UPI003B5BABE3